jgi:hypothetical protein
MSNHFNEEDQESRYDEAVLRAHDTITPHPWDRTPTPQDVHCQSCDTFIGQEEYLDEDETCPTCNETI